MDVVVRVRRGAYLADEYAFRWPSEMPIPRVGEGLSIDTANMLFDRRPPGPGLIDGVVAHVSHERRYDQSGRREQWSVLILLK